MAETPPAADPILFTNDEAAETAARNAEARLDRAMNAFWRTYHKESQEAWRCVAAALDAATFMTPSLREQIARLKAAGAEHPDDETSPG